MINEFLFSLKNYARNNKTVVAIVCIVWLSITIVIGVAMGINGREAVVKLTPEEENNVALKVIKSDSEKIEKGLILTPAKNLSTEQIEISKNYSDKIKKTKK